MSGAVVTYDCIKSFMKEVLMKIGAPEENAEMTSETLASADHSGMCTHGIQRFKTVYIDRIEKGMIDPKATPTIVRESPTTAVLDGNNGLGHVNGTIAMKMAIEKAKKYGMGMVVVRNSTHFGIAGFYSLLAAQEGMMGMAGTNARSSVAPIYADEPKLGTNPLSVAFPSDEAFPWCFDAATSISPTGRFEKFVREGKQVDPSWASKGGDTPLTDAAAFLKMYPKGEAYLHPLGGKEEVNGGHKGYCLSEMVEILSACFSTSSFLSQIEAGAKTTGKYEIGHFFIAVDISTFRDLDEFKKSVGDVNRELRAAKKRPGYDRIYTAGEKEYETCQYGLKHGVHIPQTTVDEMTELKKKYGVSVKLPWE
ncbi:malate dehydrogenase, putative [Entamoeba invadens IP1]|uniref:Malate dehydrogenase, putative n=1 Tax=Entamoeba invadens IP1 TaxID=370355 RepID=A0A0A1TZY3_ENTIV|nr:malate dehydrogenase, putative [Entamoeba invadens IP1]ELP87189.1 malate dehydrogenase, putative [Entamoeba invadens IP1]|eukprot:XP_004253960.1 malate dehydrogenase, putative [Entamoeba invadens IP1]